LEHNKIMTFNNMVEDIKNRIQRPIKEELENELYWDDSMIGKLNISNDTSEPIFIEKQSTMLDNSWNRII